VLSRSEEKLETGDVTVRAVNVPDGAVNVPGIMGEFFVVAKPLGTKSGPSCGTK
jgi:hypothetical protein